MTGASVGSLRAARLWPLLLTGGIATIYGAWLLHAGVRMSPDSHTYSRWADLLIEHRFNMSTYLREQTFVVPPVLYLLWVTLVAAMKTVLGASWTTGLLLLNWLAAGAGVYLTIATVRRLTESRLATLWAAATFVVAADLLIFMPFVLSDLLFWGMSTAVLAASLYLIRDRGGLRPTAPTAIVLAGTLLTAIAFAFRPAALPLAVFWVLTLVVWRRPSTWTMAPSWMAAGAAALFAGAIGMHAWFMMHPEQWPVPAAGGMIHLLASEYRQGILVYAPNDTNLYVTPATDVVGAARLTVQKWLYFFAPWLPTYSLAHTLLNAAFFGPVYLLSLIAVGDAVRSQGTHRHIIVMLVLFVAGLSLFHALMQIDYDHRYRLPVLPALIMLGALGLNASIGRLAHAGSHRQPVGGATP